MFITRSQLMANLDDYRHADIWANRDNPEKMYVGDIENAPLPPFERWVSVRWLDLKASVN